MYLPSMVKEWASRSVMRTRVGVRQWAVPLKRCTPRLMSSMARALRVPLTKLRTFSRRAEKLTCSDPCRILPLARSSMTLKGRTAPSKSLVGTQPRLRHVPPQLRFSTNATFLPALASILAAARPPGPAPMMMTSNASMDWLRIFLGLPNCNGLQGTTVGSLFQGSETLQNGTQKKSGRPEKPNVLTRLCLFFSKSVSSLPTSP